jgi:hypothetical protein
VRINKKVATVAAVTTAAVLLTASSCGDDSGRKAYEQRKQANKQLDPARATLEKANLRRKIALEENPNQVGYVYITSFGKPMGYYVIKGKVSSAGSQLQPEDDIVQPYSGGDRYVTDGPQDDGTYGDGDPGIFFFLADGTYVETTLDHIYSTQPIRTFLDVPKLGG